MPNSCLYCKYIKLNIELRSDGVKHKWYCCKLKPDKIKDAHEIMKGCDSFVCYDKEEKEENHGEEERSAKNKEGSNALQSDRQEGLQ